MYNKTRIFMKTVYDSRFVHYRRGIEIPHLLFADGWLHEGGVLFLISASCTARRHSCEQSFVAVIHPNEWRLTMSSIQVDLMRRPPPRHNKMTRMT